MSIELKQVSFCYPNGTLANEDLNLTIHDGERVAIIGQNGAGKTTAAKLMNALNKPTQGDVIINGVNTRDHTTAQISAMVGYVFQNPDDQIFKTTVQDEVEFWCRYRKLDEAETQRRTQRAVELSGIFRHFNSNPYEIPYSTKKFVSVASVLVAQTPYLILDEPTAGQDVAGVACLAHLMDVLTAEGTSVITITHDMEFVAANFHRVIVMAHRHIIADGTPEEIFAQEDVLREARIKKPQIGQLASRLGLEGLLRIPELVTALSK